MVGKKHKKVTARRQALFSCSTDKQEQKSTYFKKKYKLSGAATVFNVEVCGVEMTHVTGLQQADGTIRQCMHEMAGTYCVQRESYQALVQAQTTCDKIVPIGD